MWHKNNRKGHAPHGSVGHMWMMALCCGAPVIILAVISLLGASFPGIRNALAGVLPFLCPVMMIAMLPMMFRKDKGNGERADRNCHKDTDNDAQETKYLK